MVRSTLSNLNPVELNYYPFVVSPDKCSESCNVLSPKICAQKKQKTCKNYHTCKTDYSMNPSRCVGDNGKYLKIIADTSVITCDKIISAMDIVSTKMRNTIVANVSINSNDNKVRYKIDSYILHTISLATILLLIITIICYHYAKHRSKLKGIDAITI